MILVLWGIMVLQSWGIDPSFFGVPFLFHAIGLILWFFGFALLFFGRIGMGSSFRLGIPKESTILKVNGLFRFSRNPMYVGMYATVVASALYTLNLVVILLGAFVISMHHLIVLAEEGYMQNVFGLDYSEYCSRVRRYI